MSSRLPTLYSLFLNLEALAYHFYLRMVSTGQQTQWNLQNPDHQTVLASYSSEYEQSLFFFFLSLSLFKESVALRYLYYNGCNLNGSGLLQETFLVFSSLQLLSCVQFFASPWTAAHQASLSITNSQSLLKLKFIESVLPSNHLSLCHPFSSHLQSFPASGSFPMSQFFASGGQRIGVSASALVLSMNIPG